ncbi:hypothetical protein A9W94_14790 [Mycobacterium asiaticum]|uniref:Uncharacterized protein n=1 Tax=Mycobacterium asiaticum TaxID=1790 RepID=A0A1A3IIC0_MYCAS|nr:hypothetical protein A9W94_14790 [Mycobacterium asiaticum]OBJ86493.1 hypothetical protein A5640_11035 [Mycobacterium asiaticum]
MVRSPDVVTRRKGLLDDLQLVVDSGLQLKDHTTVADSFGLENYVALTAIGDRVTGVQMFDGHQFRVSV